MLTDLWQTTQRNVDLEGYDGEGMRLFPRAHEMHGEIVEQTGVVCTELFNPMHTFL